MGHSGIESTVETLRMIINQLNEWDRRGKGKTLYQPSQTEIKIESILFLKRIKKLGGIIFGRKLMSTSS